MKMMVIFIKKVSKESRKKPPYELGTTGDAPGNLSRDRDAECADQKPLKMPANNLEMLVNKELEGDRETVLLLGIRGSPKSL